MDRQGALDTTRLRCRYATRPDQRPHCQLTAVVRYGATALCADCDTRRSTLGKGQRRHPLQAQPPVDILRWIHDANTAARAARAELAAAVTRARQHGHPWADIGAALGTTRQAAQQRFRHDPSPGG